jgi:signal transduction histidine kinase
VGNVSLVLLAGSVACATLGLFHVLAWVREPRALANGLYAVFAFAVGAGVWVGLGILRAGTAEDAAQLFYWLHLPTWVGAVSLVLMVQHALGTGRVWLGWVAVGSRTLVLAVNAFSEPCIDFRDIHVAGQFEFLGERFTRLQAIPGPWAWLAGAALLLVLIHAVDAGLTLASRRDRDRDRLLGVTLVGFAAAAVALGFTLSEGVGAPTVWASLLIAPTALLLGLGLTVEVARAVRAAGALQEKTAALRLIEERLEMAAEAAGAWFWTYDGRSRRFWTTRLGYTALGLDPGRVPRLEEFLARVHPEDRDEIQRQSARLDLIGQRRRLEFRIIDPAGAVRWCVSYTSANADALGRVTFSHGLTIDVTQRRGAEDEAAQLRRDLAHLGRVAVVNQLAGNLARQLTRPLATIQTRAHRAGCLLRAHQPDCARLDAELGGVVDGAERAGRIVGRLRELVRRSPVVTATIDVDALVMSSLSLAAPDLRSLGLVVRVEAGAGGLKVMGDPPMLTQALIDVLMHIGQAMTTRAGGADVLSLSTGVGGGRVSLRVCHPGATVRQLEQQSVTGLFAVTRGGAGLGLVMARTIVQAHGGDIVGEDMAGQGAALLISLPVALEEQA